MKKLLALVAVVFGFMLYSSPAFADNSCNGQYGQYGGCPPSVTILIDKFVGKPNASLTDPKSADYVDNLSPSDPRFKAGQLVFFKAKVKNTSNTTLTNVTVKDYVPWYIEPVEGPGTYDPSTRVISFNAGDFSAGEEKLYYFKMQVFAKDKLPNDKGLFCLVNQVKAYNDNTSDDDTAQFCVEKEVLGVTNVPSSGPELGLLLLGLNFAGIGVGLALKKKV